MGEWVGVDAVGGGGEWGSYSNLRSTVLVFLI